MTPSETLALLPRLWRAETIKLFSRLTTRIGLVFFLLVAILVPALHFMLGNAGIVMSGAPMNTSAPRAIQWVLEVRSFLTMRVFIIGLTALTFAGELKARTLREDLLRPVPRWAILFSKWSTIVTWIVVTTVAMLGISAVMGVILFGTVGNWRPPLEGYATVLVCDAVFSAFVLCIAVLLRSVIGTALGVILYLVFDLMLGFVLSLAIMVNDSSLGQMVEIPGIEVAKLVQPWLPIYAFEAWRGFYPDSSFDWQNWVSLVVLFLISAAVSVFWFRRTDVQ